MRALFLTLYPESAASARYRVHQYIPHLEAAGIHCDVWPALTSEQYRRYAGRPALYHAMEFSRRWNQLRRTDTYDVVFVQKAICSAYVRGMGARTLARARRVIYDFDDAVHLRAPNRFGWPMNAFEDGNQINEVMNRADCVLAGNTWLAGAAAAAVARRIEVFPTAVDTDRFRPEAPASGRLLRIGWIGSPSTANNLELVRDALSSLSLAEITLMGAGTTSPIADSSILPWTIESEGRFLNGLHVGIMPLIDDQWNRGKCALKALQYMACGVPCVASPHGSVLEIIEHGVNGLFADSTEEWQAALERLRDPAERARLGAAGRTTVEERFSLRVMAPRMTAILESVAA